MRPMTHAVSPRRATCAARRPVAVTVAMAGPPPVHAPGETVQVRLSRLMDWLRFWEKSVEEGGRQRADLPEGPLKRLMSEDGPAGWLKFWDSNHLNFAETGRRIKEAGASLTAGNLEAFQEKLTNINFDWLKPKPLPPPKADTRTTRSSSPANLQTSPAARRALAETNVSLEKQVQGILLFLSDSLCPWDYDRHDFGLTFTNTWTDIESVSGGGGTSTANSLVKMTSTIKPLEKEWKLTARTKLLRLGEGGVVFGKAGLYLAGDLPAYIGVEADRVWTVPYLKGTKVFGNVNYRSSRKPQHDPVVASFGVQQTIPIVNGLELTLRFGVDSQLENGKPKPYVAPIPLGSYF